MKNNKFLNFLSTKFLITTIVIVIIIIVAFYLYLLQSKMYDVESINNSIDFILKLLVIVFGFIWFLNRYYTERKDFPKFDINVDFKQIKLSSEKKLLIYRIDVFNESNVLFKDYSYSLRIDGFKEIEDGVLVESIQNKSELEYKSGLPIEPNSWTAINHHQIIAKEYIALRFYYEIKKEDKPLWTWHKTYQL